MKITQANWRMVKLPIELPDGDKMSGEPGYMITTQIGKTRIRIAIIEESHYLPAEAAESCARLIHAAPDLLAACNSLVQHVTVADSHELSVAVHQARAAIAKAEGEPS